MEGSDSSVSYHELTSLLSVNTTIWSLQQGSLDLSSYYTKLKTLWDDLDGVDCVKICQSCECCKATAKKIKHTKVIKFLAGLNDSYFSARGQIIMKKHVPDLSEMYNLLDQDFFNQQNISPLQNAREYFSAQGQIIMKKTDVTNSLCSRFLEANNLPYHLGARLSRDLQIYFLPTETDE